MSLETAIKTETETYTECAIKLCDHPVYKMVIQSKNIGFCRRHYDLIEDHFQTHAKDPLNRIEEILQSEGADIERHM